MKKLCSALFVFFILTACKDEKSASSPSPTPTATVASLVGSVSISASQSSILPGTAVTLTWNGTQVLDSSCSVSGSDGKKFPFETKTATVNPTTAISYTVTCTTSTDHKPITASDTVSIAIDTPTNNVANTPPNMTIPTVSTSPGVIITVNAQNAVTIAPGASVALAYAVQGVNQGNCTLTLLPTSGQSPMFTNNIALVSPTVTTSYTFSCPNPNVGGPQLTSVATINVSTSGTIGSGGTLANCAGVQAGGFCWYLGAINQSCNSVCSTRGGPTNYNAYAGSAGTDANCGAVLGLLGVTGPASSDSTICSAGWGCYTVAGIEKSRCTNMQVTSDISSPSGRLACSCAQ